jgi:hypothetical protein
MKWNNEQKTSNTLFYLKWLISFLTTSFFKIFILLKVKTSIKYIAEK